MTLGAYCAWGLTPRPAPHREQAAELGHGVESLLAEKAGRCRGINLPKCKVPDVVITGNSLSCPQSGRFLQKILPGEGRKVAALLGGFSVSRSLCSSSLFLRLVSCHLPIKGGLSSSAVPASAAPASSPPGRALRRYLTWEQLEQESPAGCFPADV